MKATGIVRRLDDLGRIVIPKEIRRTMGVREGDPLELIVNQCGNLELVPYHSTASDQIRGIADTLSTMGSSPEEWEVAKQLNEIANTLKKIQDAE